METAPEYRIYREKAGKGRPRVTKAIGNRHLSIIARRNNGATASQLFRDLYATTSTRLSRVTVSNIHHEKESSLKDLLFASHSLLRTGEPV